MVGKNMECAQKLHSIIVTSWPPECIARARSGERLWYDKAKLKDNIGVTALCAESKNMLSKLIDEDFAEAST